MNEITKRKISKALKYYHTKYFPKILKYCKQCKKEITTRNNLKFCSSLCKKKYHEVITQCLWCKKKFWAYRNILKSGKSKFCSKKCMILYFAQFKNHCIDCNKLIAFRNKRCRKCKDKFCRKHNHPNWLGGISFKPYSLDWTENLKECIRDRDNHKCQICGCPEIENMKSLDVHHVDYNKKDCNPNNLISLCNSCHHKTNFNRKYWTCYFQNKTKEKIWTG